MRVAGIMSGTSLDGIDVAIVEIHGPGKISTLALRTTPYSPRVRRALLAISNARAHTGEVSRLDFLLGELYARALVRLCERSSIPLKSIALIGCHGQTIFHGPESTLQIGEAAVLAERTGIPVVSDFRPRDMAAGGRGAPLVPYVDYVLFRDERLGRVVLNIGGIANLTAIPAGGRPEQVLAFDTGPGNMVLDALTAHYTRGRQRFDRGGKIARSGSVDQRLLRVLLNDKYYRSQPPKTAGREQYGAAFVDRLIRTHHSLPDLMATAAALTAASVAEGIERFVRPRMKIDELIVSGGGVHNPAVMAFLAALVPNVGLATSSDFGIDADGKEAIAFAILAHETWHHRASNLPSATGAKRPVVLGKITP